MYLAGITCFFYWINRHGRSITFLETMSPMGLMFCCVGFVGCGWFVFYSENSVTAGGI